MPMPPPKKKPAGPPMPPGGGADLLSAFGGGPPMPPGMPGDPMMGGMDPMAGGMDPMAAMMAPPPLGGPPGMPPPGKGMDPMAAMMGGLGPPPVPTQPGPGGLPLGGSMPDGDGDEMGGSDLLSSLSGSLGDPYDQPPGAPNLSLAGQPAGDPQMASLMELLALQMLGVNPADAGIGGGMGGGMGGGPPMGY